MDTQQFNQASKNLREALNQYQGELCNLEQEPSNAPVLFALIDELSTEMNTVSGGLQCTSQFQQMGAPVNLVVL